jgi:hypothetical protein
MLPENKRQYDFPLFFCVGIYKDVFSCQVWQQAVKLAYLHLILLDVAKDGEKNSS